MTECFQFEISNEIKDSDNNHQWLWKTLDGEIYDRWIKLMIPEHTKFIYMEGEQTDIICFLIWHNGRYIYKTPYHTVMPDKQRVYSKDRRQKSIKRYHSNAFSKFQNVWNLTEQWTWFLRIFIL